MFEASSFTHDAIWNKSLNMLQQLEKKCKFVSELKDTAEMIKSSSLLYLDCVSPN